MHRRSFAAGLAASSAFAALPRQGQAAEKVEGGGGKAGRAGKVGQDGAGSAGGAAAEEADASWTQYIGADVLTSLDDPGTVHHD